MDAQDVSNLLLKEGCSMMTLCLDESYLDDARGEILANSLTHKLKILSMVRNNYLTEHGICCNIDEVKSWEGKNIRTALKERMEEKLSHIATLNEEFKQMES